LKIREFFFICSVLVDYSQLSDSLKEASDMEKTVQELQSKIEDTMFKIRTKEPNMKVNFMAIIYSVFLYSSFNVTEYGREVECQSFLISASDGQLHIQAMIMRLVWPQSGSRHSELGKFPC
jgi:hypothetical protein